MTDGRPLDDGEFDALARAAREAAPRPSAELVERILADADSVSAKASAPSPRRRRGALAAFLPAIGGWPAMAGLATAAAAGVAIGVAVPDLLDGWTGGYVSAATGFGLDALAPSLGGVLATG